MTAEYAKRIAISNYKSKIVDIVLDHIDKLVNSKTPKFSFALKTRGNQFTISDQIVLESMGYNVERNCAENIQIGWDYHIKNSTTYKISWA